MDHTPTNFSPLETGRPDVRPTAQPDHPSSHGKGPWRWIVIVALIVAAVAGWKFFSTPKPDADQTAAASKSGRRSERTGPQPVGVATVQPRDIHVTINALGSATPLASVTVVSQLSGFLQEVGFSEGQRVKKGDFLAQIDPRPYQALKAQYEGQLAHDQGLLDQARIDDVRYQALLKQNSIARQTAEDQIYIVKQYEGSVRADQALIDAQALNIAYCRILSPVTGRIGLRQVDPGNFIQAGNASGSSTGIAVVTQMQPMSVIFSVPEDALSKILPKMRGGGQLPATAYDRSNVKLLGNGKTYALDATVDATTGMVKLRAQFDNDDEALFPNQFVNVRLLVETLPGVLAAPVSAIQHGAPGDYAYVITGDNKSSVRVVKLGQVDGDYVQILSGLNAGDRIVLDGADRLREGAEVRVVSEAQVDAAPVAEAAVEDASAAPPAAAGDAADREERRRRYRERKAAGSSDGKPASAN